MDQKSKTEIEQEIKKLYTRALINIKRISMIYMKSSPMKTDLVWLKQKN